MVLEQIIVGGAINSFIYALLALGFTLIYGVSGIINLAHGSSILIGGFIFGALAVFFTSFFPAGFLFTVPVLALIVATILTGIIGSVFYRLTLHQILGDEVAILVTSVSASVIFVQSIYLAFGATLAMRYPLPSLLPGTFTLANVQIVNGQALAAILSVLLFAGLWIFTSKTKSGKAMRALSQDLEAAMLVGVSVEKMYMLTSAIAAGIACVAGVFYYSSVTLAVGNTAQYWLLPLAWSFTVVILGGLGSIKGTLIGALIFGYTDTIFRQSFPNTGELIFSFPFIIMILALIIKPKGLFGKRTEME